MVEHLDAAKNEKKVPPFQSRWRFEAEITTAAPLHIGSGEPTNREELLGKGDETTRINAVVTDHLGRAYLPGKAIKGALRSWLGYLKDPPQAMKGTVEQLFGTEYTRNMGFVGGKSEFCNAFFVTRAAFRQNPPYWCKDRLTGVMAHTAIARTTRTVRDEKLYHEEFVPPGVTFRVIVTAQNLTDDEAALLLFALQGFAHPTFPVRLGAGEQNLRGAFSVDSNSIKVSRLTRDGLKDWFTKRPLPVGMKDWQVPGGGYDGLPPLGDAETKALQERASKLFPGLCPPNRHVIRLRLTFDPAFMVHDPSRGQAQTGDPTLSGHRALLDTGRDVLLPADSFRGAFRSQAERILRTLGIHACDPQGPDACKAIHAKGEETKLCPACRLFGAGGWASALQISDFTAVEGQRGEPNRQDFVAIDRFTGGASGSRKFDAEPFWNPILEGTIALELDRTEPWALGLIGLTLRDLIEGDITFGFGAAKGYGVCTMEVMDATNPAHPEKMKGWEELAECLRDSSKGGAWGPLDLMPFVRTLRGGINTPSAYFGAWKHNGAGRAEGIVDLPEDRDEHEFDAPARNDNPGVNFHNPYHFVPAKQEGSEDDKEAEAVRRGELSYMSHDQYYEDTFSGRIICRLTTKTPLVIGSKQEPHINGSKKILPFFLGGEPAIPSSSLRGLLSSYAEAASNSALRVLNNAALSHRATREEAAHAIGILMRTRSGEMRLRPLTLPLVTRNAAGNYANGDFGQAVLKVYIDGYHNLTPEGFLAGTPPPQSFSADHHEHWYLALSGGVPLDGATIDTAQAGHLKMVGNRILSQRPANGSHPISETEWQILPPGQRNLYTKGILRVLGVAGRQDSIPSTKHHEIFIPVDLAAPYAGPLLDAKDAVADFHRLADERTKTDRSLPFEVMGSRRNANGDPTDQRIRLRPGDLVFFTPGGAGRVKRVSVSSIWRLDNNTVHEYFKGIHHDLLPFNPERGVVSIAEQIFGLVEQGLDNYPLDESALSYAGRLRTGFGRLSLGQTPPFLCEVGHEKLLKILASPKPPSPAMYFKPGYITKSQLKPRDPEAANPENGYVPQGRKFYLHHPRLTEADWVDGRGEDSPHLSQQVWVRPVRPEVAFHFHIDFSNLSERELALLSFVLEPGQNFQHKLGMGKPLGLGSVKIKPLRLMCVKRHQRYGSDPLDAPRYQLATPPYAQQVQESFYAAELQAEVAQAAPNLANLAARYAGTMDADILKAMVLLGDPAFVTFPVEYPHAIGQADDERLFTWFMNNDDQHQAQHQHLNALQSNSHALLPLRRNRHP